MSENELQWAKPRRGPYRLRPRFDRGSGYPYGEFDASRWAAEFDRIFPDSRPDTGTMLSWFANAIMTGYDKAKNEEAKFFTVTATERVERLEAERLAQAIKNVEWVRGEKVSPNMDWFRAYARNIAIEYAALSETAEPSRE